MPAIDPISIGTVSLAPSPPDMCRFLPEVRPALRTVFTPRREAWTRIRQWKSQAQPTEREVIIMPQLRVNLEAPATRDVLPGDFTVTATLTNESNQAAVLNPAQASHPSLVLEVRDERDRPVLMPPPSAPDSKELEIREEIGPDRSFTVTYAGFLDLSLSEGAYRVRFISESPSLGGTSEDPLASDWLEFHTRKATEVAAIAEPLKTLAGTGEVIAVRPTLYAGWISAFLHWILCFLLRICRRSCDKVLTREVDENRTETISNAPAGSEAWNGTYSWRARFHVRVDQPSCRVTVTLKVRLNGAITQAQRDAWESAIESAWTNRFKLCCSCCCCTDGYTIHTDIQFVDSGEHQVVTVGDTTTNMGNWGRDDATDVGHEFGHMLGALDEYFTVNGVDYGAGRQPGGNIMNNPANDPVADHYDVVRAAVQDMLGTNCTTVPLSQKC